MTSPRLHEIWSFYYTIPMKRFDSRISILKVMTLLIDDGLSTFQFHLWECLILGKTNSTDPVMQWRASQNLHIFTYQALLPITKWDREVSWSKEGFDP